MKHTFQDRNSLGNNYETNLLKELAHKVLERSNKRNKAETKVDNVVSGAHKNLVFSETEILELYEERAAIREFEGGFIREEAEMLSEMEVINMIVKNKHPEISKAFRKVININNRQGDNYERQI